MKKTIVLAAALACAVAAGCGGKSKDKGMTEGSGMAMGSDMGSGMASGSDMVGTGSATPVETKPAPPPPPPPPKKTPDEMVARYQECWGFFNDAKWDDFKGCYTSDVISSNPGSGQPDLNGVDAVIANAQGFKEAFPDLKGDLQIVLQNGNHSLSVALLTGTNTGTMKTPMGEMKPSKKKVGYLFAHTVDFNDQGMVTKEWAFWDMGTMMTQIGASKMPARKAMAKGAASPEVVVAKDDDKEKANVAVLQAAMDAFSKHDEKAFDALLAKDVVWYEAASPKDDNKKSVIANSKQFWKGFSDVKLTAQTTWGAGDYAVAIGTLDGTNDGDMPAMKLKKTGKSVSVPFMHLVKVVDGKIQKSWIFFQGMAFASQLGMMPPAPAPKTK